MLLWLASRTSSLRKKCGTKVNDLTLNFTADSITNNYIIMSKFSSFSLFFLIKSAKALQVADVKKIKQLSGAFEVLKFEK